MPEDDAFANDNKEVPVVNPQLEALSNQYKKKTDILQAAFNKEEKQFLIKWDLSKQEAMLEFNSAKRPLDEEKARLEAQDKII